jgi:CTP:molybdopterin cytidylyltransferase MocA
MALRFEIGIRARIAAGAVEVIAAVILAAGASSRMGRPKAFLEYRGETFLARLVRTFRVYCEDVVVVVSGGAPVTGARIAVNPDPERGMLSSLQCGFQALPPEVRAVAFTPVDHPAIEPNTIEQVVTGWSGELLRIPRHSGRRGHPVLAAAGLIPEFLALPPGAQARDVVSRHERDIVYVDVDDPGILKDVDTPAEYEQLR